MKKTDVFSYEKPVPVILGCYVNGLGLIRSFGEAGVPTIGMDMKKNIGMYSKFVKGYVCPNPSTKEFITYLKNLGKKLKNKGVLFPSYDNWLLPISKHQEELSKYFIYPMSSWDVIQKCADKSFLYKIAEENNIPIPKTIFIKSISELEDKKNEIDFPYVIKPFNPTLFKETSIGTMVLIVKNKFELESWIKKIVRNKLNNEPLIIQEYIEGRVENLYTFTSYANKKSEVIAYFSGFKIRQFPPEAGTIKCGKLKDEPEIFTLGSKLIKSLGFYGISNIEFKKDPKGNFKLMEINPRSGMWTYSSTACGVNLPYIAYQELIGEKIEGLLKTDKERVWLTLLDDLYFSLIWYKKAGYPNSQIPFYQWLKSVKGKKIYGVLSLRDPMPGLKFAINLINSWRKQ